MSYTPTEWKAGDVITSEGLNHMETGIEGVNMSYTPNTWQTGDIITAEKLNNIEQGIAGAGGEYGSAVVTFINTAAGTGYHITILGATEDGLTVEEYIVEGGTDVQITVPLYNGKLVYPFSGSNFDTQDMPTWSGGVAMDESLVNFIITGDGSFSAKGEH